MASISVIKSAHSKKKHLENVSFSEPNFEPFANRENLNCGRNLTINDLCNPCGVSCHQESCDNWKCAVACADRNFVDRVFDEASNSTNPKKSIYFKLKDDVPSLVKTSGTVKPNSLVFLLWKCLCKYDAKL